MKLGFTPCQMCHKIAGGWRDPALDVDGPLPPETRSALLASAREVAAGAFGLHVIGHHPQAVPPLPQLADDCPACWNLMASQPDQDTLPADPAVLQHLLGHLVAHVTASPPKQ